ncbi:unnamed protein product [Lasius platythorax]|uniref:Nose resistant to fluoxetine protein 6 n=2 Tax=Lasius TaxID=488720 RepID=A0A0J7JYY6_LASNI|nr:nose resistant to fluoxetine protein 6 [Lasius niger]
MKKTSIKRERSGEQSETSSLSIESFADEDAAVIQRGRSIDTKDNRTSSKSGTNKTDSVSTEYSKNIRDGDHRQSSKSEIDDDSGKFNWLGAEEDEDEIYRTDCRRKSEEENWDWERRET